MVYAIAAVAGVLFSGKKSALNALSSIGELSVKCGPLQSSGSAATGDSVDGTDMKWGAVLELIGYHYI